MPDENEIEEAVYTIYQYCDDITEVLKNLLAPRLAKLKELEAENAASMREIAIGRERAEKAEAENATLRSMLGGATEDIFNKYVEDIQAYENRARSAEAKVATLTANLNSARLQAKINETALRKQLVVDDAMVEAASEIEKLCAERDAAITALKPFASCVFIDNRYRAVAYHRVENKDYFKAYEICYSKKESKDERKI